MNARYKLLTFLDASGASRAGVLINENIVTVTDLLRAAGAGENNASVSELLDDWPNVGPRIQQAINAQNVAELPSQALNGTTLLAPIARPGTLYCAGINYRDHIIEMARVRNSEPELDQRETGFKPWHFTKPARSCIVGTGTTVARPQGCEKLDWEVELAVIIGKEARNVAVSDALSYVAGYAVANDLSARDLSRRPQPGADSPFKHDWLAHKGFEGSNPLGPWITPAHDIPDPQRLAIKLWVNDVLKQDSNTSEMIYSAAEQIAHLSELRTLYPGDIILTGTPAGVGSGRQEFLQPGDRVRVEIEGLGRLDTLIA